MNAAVSNTSSSATTATVTTTGQNAAAYPATYQEYYQQYMQYMYSMNLYGNYAAYATTSTTTPSYYTPPVTTTSVTATNITNTVSTLTLTTPPPPPPPPETQQGGKSAPIKFNLKFQQQTPTQQPKLLVPPVKTPQSSTTQDSSIGAQPGRKSRFDIPPSSTPNVLKQQNLYQEYQQKQREKLAIAASTAQKVVESKQKEVSVASTGEANDNAIISDINKWPVSLKNYCSRLFTIYHSNKVVSEHQVTNYLQTRITEAFKIKSDLNINWDAEKIPDVQTIKKALLTPSNKPTTTINQPQYNQVPPPSPKTPQTKPTEIGNQRTPFQQRIINQQQLKIQQQVSNNKRKSKSKSPSSDKSSTTSSGSLSASNKKFKKDQPKVLNSKIKRNLSDDDEDEDDEEEEEEEAYESSNNSEEDFKPLSKQQKKMIKKAK